MSLLYHFRSISNTLMIERQKRTVNSFGETVVSLEKTLEIQGIFLPKGKAREFIGGDVPAERYDGALYTECNTLRTDDVVSVDGMKYRIVSTGTNKDPITGKFDHSVYATVKYG